MVTPDVFSAALRDAISKLYCLEVLLTEALCEDEEIAVVQEMVADFEAAWSQCCTAWPEFDPIFAAVRPSRVRNIHSALGLKPEDIDAGSVHKVVMEAVSRHRKALAEATVAGADDTWLARLVHGDASLAEAIVETIRQEKPIKIRSMNPPRLSDALEEESGRACWQLFAIELAESLRELAAPDGGQVRRRPILNDDPICVATGAIEATIKRPLPPPVAHPLAELLQLSPHQPEQLNRLKHLAEHLHACAVKMAQGAREQKLPPYEAASIPVQEPVAVKPADRLSADGKADTEKKASRKRRRNQAGKDD